MNQVQLGSTVVGSDTRPYVIAEIGVNHEGSMEVAKRLIREAKESGCPAAKFQTSPPSTPAAQATSCTLPRASFAGAEKMGMLVGFLHRLDSVGSI